MVCAGLAAFALLYATQALLPDIGGAFGVGATAASLTVAVTTGTVALAVLPMSAFAERVGRTRVMGAALAVACGAVLAGSLAPTLWVLLVARAVDGLALAGVVAVAMGHLGAEVERAASGPAIGLYVSGTTVGGLLGRLVPAGMNDLAGWRWSLEVLAGICAVFTIVFVRTVPPTRRSDPPPRHASAAVTHLRDPGIVRLCLVALLFMGGFVAIYNYLTYRLRAEPFGLSSGAVGLVFLAYLSGTVSSTAAARAAVRFGRRTVLLAAAAVSVAGLLVTLSPNLVAVLVGLVVFTTGFFGVHSVASGWVAGRASGGASQASALYLMAYYLGSSIGGTAIGLAWSAGGWPATVLAVGACYLVGGTIAAGIHERDPDAEPAG